LLVAISGPTSSGKTTVARHLLRLLHSLAPDGPPATQPLLIHEDDFYRSDTDIPVKDGVQDWDCLEAIDVPVFEAALLEIRGGGRLPDGFKSLELPEDNGSTADGVHDVPDRAQNDSGISEALLTRLRERLRDVLEVPSNNGQGTAVKFRVCLVEGFLLFQPAMFTTPGVFDLKLLLLASHAAAKQRREARSGYVTLEGFWTDPPGYVDKIVWPNYVESHAAYFQNGDVEGAVDERFCRDEAVKPYPPGGLQHAEGGTIARMLEWAV
ncbi:hypothetical protein P152DRAFT_378330, partial [Eremomyces bilateralis CBS 781.70]